MEDDRCVCLSLVIPPKQSRLLLGNGLGLCGMPSHGAAVTQLLQCLGATSSRLCCSGTAPLRSPSHLQSVLIDTRQKSLIEQAYRVHSTEKTMDAGILPTDTPSPDSSASGACLTSQATNTIATGHTITRERMAMLGFPKTLRDPLRGSAFFVCLTAWSKGLMVVSPLVLIFGPGWANLLAFSGGDVNKSQTKV